MVPRLLRSSDLPILKDVSLISRCLLEYTTRFRLLWRVSQLTELAILPCTDACDSGMQKVREDLGFFYRPKASLWPGQSHSSISPCECKSIIPLDID